MRVSAGTEPDNENQTNETNQYQNIPDLPQNTLTLIHRELYDLLDFATERVLDALLMVAALDGQILGRNVLGATCVIVTVALEAPNCRSCQ